MTSRRDMSNRYAKRAYRLLWRIERPSLNDVYNNVCRRNNCPVDTCSYPGGKAKGMDCGHVISVKTLINKILNVIDNE